MKELSIFVDESGDSGDYSEHSSYYIISLIMHNLRNDIDADIGKLDMHDGASFFSYSNSMDDDMTAIRHRYISSAGQGNAAIHRP